ncbi:MAG TPA: acetyl-CoA hydrolase/transferase C-terminal domain-containing protein [Thermomicrobiales bacterium]|nr:acetyl-CoA hydrolase/transferase C-terminal domain-containing protein [Thermomicrobiales bacterium]
MTSDSISRLQSKLATAAQAVARVRSGDRVFVHGGCATPSGLVDALVQRAPELRDVLVCHLHTEGPATYAAPGYEQSFRHVALFVGSNTRDAVNSGRAEYIPAFLSEVPSMFRSGRLPIDVALLNLSAPDAHGFCSLGVSVDVAMAAARAAKTVIAQINTAMPRTHGASFIHIDQIDAAVEVHIPPVALQPARLSATDEKIGAFVAGLVEDQSTLQLGIGSIPNAVLAALGGHKDLAIHSEMFSDGVMALVDAGVITARYNPIHPGKLITSFLMGSERLYAFADDNPGLEMHPADYTNDTAVIRRNHRMIAVNSAIEIDLTGQVCSSSIGERIYSGFGGQVDFMRGATLADNGRSILALPATARGGVESRIVGRLRPGAMVTLTQAHVRFVVTEFGVADLYGRTLRERAAALISIAHPSFRDDLFAFARDHNLAGHPIAVPPLPNG